MLGCGIFSEIGAEGDGRLERAGKNAPRGEVYEGRPAMQRLPIFPPLIFVTRTARCLRLKLPLY